MDMPLNQNETLLMFCRTTKFLNDNPNLNQKELKEILQSDQPEEAKVEILIDLVDTLEDEAYDGYDLPLLYEITSDDDGGSSAGPWNSTVYGTTSLWLPNENVLSSDIPGFFKFQSIDFEDAFFDEYYSAKCWADDHAHEVTIEIVENINVNRRG
ncbi:hypothetical protein OAL54_01600 [Gammaproteobacteria bacterium]|nr:hypothetical protein [Gammaproteobacteria bacterium]